MERHGLELEEATPQAVAEGLTPFETTSERPFLWKEALAFAAKVGGESPGLGEVRTWRDWRVLPRGRAIRVLAVASDEDLVIRWADTNAVEVVRLLGTTRHDALVARGDHGKRLRVGYVTVDPRAKHLDVTSRPSG